MIVDSSDPKRPPRKEISVKRQIVWFKSEKKNLHQRFTTGIYSQRQKQAEMKIRLGFKKTATGHWCIDIADHPPGRSHLYLTL